MSGDHNEQKDKSFECPRCGRCCTDQYERGFVDGMQHQLSLKINKEPTKIFGPNLEEILNRAGFYKKREWVGLTGDEARKFYEKYTDREELIYAINEFLEEKNT
jgi:Fe-S-cluster containining protein